MITITFSPSQLQFAISCMNQTELSELKYMVDEAYDKLTKSAKFDYAKYPLMEEEKEIAIYTRIQATNAYYDRLKKKGCSLEDAANAINFYCRIKKP